MANADSNVQSCETAWLLNHCPVVFDSHMYNLFSDPGLWVVLGIILFKVYKINKIFGLSKLAFCNIINKSTIDVRASNVR